MKNYTKILAIASVLILTGCVTKEDCDPRREAGFFNKIGCTVTGTYSDRIADKEAEIDSLAQEKDMLEAMLYEAQQQKQVLESDYSARQEYLDDLETKVANLKKTVNQKQALQGQLKKDIADLEKAIQDNKKMPKNASKATQKKNVANLTSALSKVNGSFNDTANKITD